MTKTISAATLPPLRLADPDKFALQQLSAELQREIVHEYESYFFQANRGVDEERWKLTRSDGDIHAFVERKSALHKDLQATKRSRSAYHYSPTSSSSPVKAKPHATLAVESQRRRVLVTGLVAGTLDDIMLGYTFQDTESYRAMWASQSRKMSECAVLATIEGATVDDPYRFLGVTWFLRSFGLRNAILKRRDLLTLTDVHLSKLSNGDRIGISMSHSIQHRDLGGLQEFGAIRATTSVLRVFRQFDDNHVEVFMTHFLDTKGSTPEAFDLRESVGYMLPSAGFFMAAGLHKKLQWLLHHHRSINMQSTTHDWIEPSCSGSADQCELCDRRVGKLFSSQATSCQVCLKRVCVHCSLTQHLPVTVSPSNDAAFNAVDCCVECFLHAKTLSSFDVAREELHHQRKPSFEVMTDRSGNIETRTRTLTVLIPENECIS